ncbi:hypothetical protein AXG93_1069s1020 [Marchantia polymorpha subsp. ruderalis]|uniref:Uncharacterized protein n=1 Tax=Marchantia polymorpha subsp. ruderalis TaxID=1480154 RepID=A0A176WEG4_MARPO|nr:hypothetical protein AXG93_1069s1020 [Marchantia polymorpha subsp. ruderalis]
MWPMRPSLNVAAAAATLRTGAERAEGRASSCRGEEVGEARGEEADRWLAAGAGSYEGEGERGTGDGGGWGWGAMSIWAVSAVVVKRRRRSSGMGGRGAGGGREGGREAGRELSAMKVVDGTRHSTGSGGVSRKTVEKRALAKGNGIFSPESICA